MDILKKIKLALYGVSIIEIITFGELFKRSGAVIMPVITAFLLAVNYAVYKYVEKRKKDYETRK